MLIKVTEVKTHSPNQLLLLSQTKINVLGVVENMSGVQRELNDVKFIGADGVDQTAVFMQVTNPVIMSMAFGIPPN